MPAQKRGGHFIHEAHSIQAVNACNAIFCWHQEKTKSLKGFKAHKTTAQKIQVSKICSNSPYKVLFLDKYKKTCWQNFNSKTKQFLIL